MYPWIERIGSKAREHWQRVLVVTICLALVLLRLLFPSAKVDWMTVTLVAIATLVILAPRRDTMLPYFTRALPYIKKAKAAGFEIELSDEIRKLGQDIDKAEESIATTEGLQLPAEYSEYLDEIRQALQGDPRAALLLLAARIEEQVRDRLLKHGLLQGGRFVPVSAAIELGIKHQVFPQQIQGPFRDFWAVRNQIAHGHAFDIDTNIVLSLVSLGIELLKMISLERTDGPGDPQ